MLVSRAEKSPFKILLIESQNQTSATVQTTLACPLFFSQKGGSEFELITISSLASSVDHLKKCDVDIILLDLNLSDSQGLDTYKKISQLVPHLPIVILADAENDDGLAVEVMHLGAQDCLYKNELDGRLLPRALRYAIERKKVEEALRKSETQLVEAQKLSQLGSWEWDVAHNKIYWSDELYRIYGLSPQEGGLDYEQFLNYIHPDDRDLIQTTVEKAYRDFKPFEFFHRIVKPNGSVRILHGRGKIILNSEGAPVRMIGTAQDVTIRRQMELELATRTSELMRSNTELEQFAYIASHDLQEPLRKIITFGDYLKKSIVSHLSDTEQNYIDRMQNAALRMRQLIEDLLQYSRVMAKPTYFEDVSLSTVLDEVLSDLEVSIVQSKAVVEVEPLPTLQADALQMRQLLQNMISNAIKFHRPNTMPHVTIQCSSQRDDWIEIAITDNGIGFDETYTERIFKPFQRLTSRSEYDGTGMGLTICQKIVAHHQGEIKVKSVLGVGSTFTIRLPMVTPTIQPETCKGMLISG